MAFHQLLSEKELQIAPVGLYLVAGDNGEPLEEIRSVYNALSDEWLKDIPARLMARVRMDGPEKPVGVEGIVARADGLEIIKAWVPVALIDAAEQSDLAQASDAVAIAPVAVASGDTPVSMNEASATAITAAPSCPNCAAALLNPVIHGLTVCPTCGRTIALTNGFAAIATSTDTVRLSADTIKALKQLRPKR